MKRKQDFFVDEAGDTTLFGRYGRLLVGTEAVSRFFLVGRLEVADLVALEADMAALRAQLLADPLLKDVPSMQAAAGKTALFFHAKDDVPEVRHAVFSLLLRHELRFTSVVKDKLVLFADVQRRMLADAAYRYKSDGHEVYDKLIGELFGRLGQFGAQRHVTFAVRGAKPRTHALQQVLDKIDSDSDHYLGFAPHGQTKIHSCYPAQSAGLQACDYLLWALQRFYERAEERFLKAMWPHFSQVIDLEAGEFHEKHPLTLVNRAGVGMRVPDDIG